MKIMVKRIVNLLFVTITSLGQEISVKVGDIRTVVLNGTFNTKYNINSTFFLSKSENFKISNYSDPKVLVYPCDLISYRFTWFSNLKANNTNLEVVCLCLKYERIIIFHKSPSSEKYFQTWLFSLKNISSEANWYMMVSNFTNMVTTIGRFEQIGESKSEFRVKANFINFQRYFKKKTNKFKFLGSREEELHFGGIFLNEKRELRHGLGVENCFFWFRKKTENLKFFKEDSYVFYFNTSVLKTGKRNHGVFYLESFKFENIFSKDVIRNGNSTFLVVYGKKRGIERSQVCFYLIMEERKKLKLVEKENFLFGQNPGFLYSNSDNSTILITQFDKQKNFFRAEIFKVKFKEKISFKKIFEKIYFIPLNYDNYELYPEEGFNLDNTAGLKFYSKNSNQYKFTLTLTYNLIYNKTKKKEEIKSFLVNYNAAEREDGEGLVFPFLMKNGAETKFISFEITRSGIFKPSIPSTRWSEKTNILKVQIKAERKKNLDVSSEKFKKIGITVFNITEKTPEFKNTEFPIILYKDSLQKIKMNFKNTKEIAYKNEFSQILSINDKTFSGSLIKVKSGSEDNKVEIFHQKSNDVKIEFRKGSEVPILDHVYHIKNGIFGVTNRLKVFFLKCEIIRKEKSFQFVFLCDFEKYLNIDFIKSDIMDFMESEKHVGFLTNKIDSEASFLYVVEKSTKKVSKIKVNRTRYTNFLLDNLKQSQPGFRYILYKSGSSSKDMKWMTTIYSNGKFQKYSNLTINSYSNFKTALQNQKCVQSISFIPGNSHFFAYFTIINYCQKNQEKLFALKGLLFRFSSIKLVVSDFNILGFQVDLGSLPEIERKSLKTCSFQGGVTLIKTQTRLFAKISSASADYYDFDLHRFNFEKNLKLICFANLGYATLIGKIKNQRKMGILTVDLREGSKKKFFDVNGRIYDYFERDFLQTHPDFIRGFDVSPNSNFPQIVIQFIMYRKFYSSLISLKGPLVFVKYPENSLNGKKDFVAYNGEAKTKFQIYFNMINSQVSKINAIAVKKNVNKTLKAEKFKLKDLLKIEGHTTKIFLQYQSGVKKLLSITKERIIFEKNIPKLDFKDKNCGLIRIKFPIIVALCGVGNLKYLRIIHKKYGLVRYQPLDKIRYNQALSDNYAKFEFNNYLDFAFEKVNHTRIKIKETHLIVITLMKKVPKKVSDEKGADYRESSPVVFWMCFEDQGYAFVYNKTFIHDHEYKKFIQSNFEEKSFSFMTNTSRIFSFLSLTTVYAIRNNHRNRDSGFSMKVLSTRIKPKQLMRPIKLDHLGRKVREIHLYHNSPSTFTNRSHTTFMEENGGCARYFHIQIPQLHVLILYTEVNRYKISKSDISTRSLIRLPRKSTNFLNEYQYGSFEVADCQKLSDYKFRCAKVLNTNQIVIMDYEVSGKMEKSFREKIPYLNPKEIKIVGKIEIYNKHTREIYEKIRLGQKHIACLLLHMQTSKSILMIYRRKKKLEKIGEKIEKTEFDNVFYSLPLLRFTNSKNFKNVQFYFESDNEKEEILVVYNANEGKFERFKIGELELEQKKGEIENYVGADFKIENLQSEMKKKLTDIFIFKELNKKLDTGKEGKNVDNPDDNLFQYSIVMFSLFLLALVILLYVIRREKLKIRELKEAEKNMIYDLEDFNF